MSIAPGKLGESIQEKELLFGFWVTNEDEVLRDLSEAGECASFIGVGYLGLFGLRLMKGPWSVQGCLLRQRTKEEKYLVDVSLVMKGASAGFLVFA